MSNGAGGAPLAGERPRMRMQIDRSAVPCQQCGVSFEEMADEQVLDHLDFWISEGLHAAEDEDPERVAGAMRAAGCYMAEMVARPGFRVGKPRLGIVGRIIGRGQQQEAEDG